MSDDEVREKAIWYWQDRLAKFFPKSKGPTGTEVDMFRAGYKMGRQSMCGRCGGKGSYSYDENHGKPCEACCPHDRGWWELVQNYGSDNGKLCCNLGCGAVCEKD